MINVEGMVEQAKKQKWISKGIKNKTSIRKDLGLKTRPEKERIKGNIGIFKKVNNAKKDGTSTNKSSKEKGVVEKG